MIRLWKTAPITMTVSARTKPRNAARFTSGRAALAADPPGSDRATDLLLERLEEARSEDEHHRPEHVERVVVGDRQPLRGEDLEAVRAETDDDQARADGPRAFGYGKLLGGACQPLYALSHEHDRLLGLLRSILSWDGRRAGKRERGGGVASARAETVHSDRIANADIVVSTRTYIVLAALTGLLILVAFATQVSLVNR